MIRDSVGATTCGHAMLILSNAAISLLVGKCISVPRCSFAIPLAADLVAFFLALDFAGF